MRSPEDIERLLVELGESLASLDARRHKVLQQIAELEQEKASRFLNERAHSQPGIPLPVSSQSSRTAKITLFRSLFRGREDVYARRFEDLKTGKKGYWPVGRRNREVGVGEFLPLTDEVAMNHLLGVDPQDKYKRDFTIGVYPMLPDETCYFLATDFDKASWQVLSTLSAIAKTSFASSAATKAKSRPVAITPVPRTAFPSLLIDRLGFFSG